MPYQHATGHTREEITFVELESDGQPATALVGTYTITIKEETIEGTNGFNKDHYDINYSEAGQLEVLPRPITVSVDDPGWKYYGEPDPVYTYSISSVDTGITTFVMSWDKVDVVTITRDLFGPPAVHCDVGTYTVTLVAIRIIENPKGENQDKTGNYSITFVHDDLEITTASPLSTMTWR